MLLDQIVNPNDIKKIDREDYNILSDEIREFLIEKISDCGGHLASNLGVVELTMALHLCLNMPEDKIIWDVGHQSYTHKILTGRKDEFNGLRTYGGISGFPKRRESECDPFGTGHSSTSISAALGIANGFQINGNNSTVVAVIGDGAFTGGMAYEALNNAAQLKRNFIIILNDNNMSISENVGGFSAYLSGLRTADVYTELKSGVKNTLNKIPVVGEKIVHHVDKTKSSLKQLMVPGMFFENMGITYLGPIDGHNIQQMVKVFNEAKKLDHAVLVHVVTQKGKGYEYAERKPSKFHGVEPFDKNTGEILKPKNRPSYTDIFSKVITNLAAENRKIVAITAAMADGTGLNKFSKHFPSRFFDVGIAEEHAVTFSAGLAAAGLKPYVAIYSSFLQRAYDQILHDVCIQDLPVVFAIDRAGLVGGDGETHQGIFDLSYLNSIPNMSIFAPKNKYELADVLKYSTYYEGPFAIRYPRGEAYEGLKEFRAPIVYGRSEILYKEKDIAILAVGSMVETAVEVRDRLKKMGYRVTVVNVRFVKPIDEKCIEKLTEDHKLIVTLEENVLNGGYGEIVTRFISGFDRKIEVCNIGVPNLYLEHGAVELLRKECGLDTDSIINKIVRKVHSMDEFEKMEVRGVHE
ncbi:MAG: 1-deoxy-D-xylulose-5-phosphate synthase [Lachnospiraceae bacterium]|nr:1-deoxy-D-xylulose-5-phosphate synthase [Lachnospiraceae bacterium]